MEGAQVELKNVLVESGACKKTKKAILRELHNKLNSVLRQNITNRRVGAVG